MPKPIFRENNLVDIIHENINLLKELDNSIDINFKKDFNKITLESDKEQISRVFLNLIKNSIESINQKAQNNNNFSKKITIELTEDDSHIKVTIEDNGVGFNELKNNIKDILNPYFTTKKNGTGLGLSIVNKIINDHNGKIDFIPIKNGAKINITFLKIIMSEEILIVDDNADIRNIINELIIDAGYKTRLAANYNQALAEIDKKLPDVAILDVKLDKGDNDGIELLSHIKSKNKDTPVIIISGHANIEMAVKSLQHGAFEFIEKPFDQERLLNFVKRAVENFNLKKQNKEYESKLFSSYELIGNSKNIVNIIDQIKKISVTESRVFISGPSGSGKELIARKIHKASSRSKNPFIVLKWCFTRYQQV